MTGTSRSAAWPATVAAALMIAAQVGGKATRDALFLDVFPATELPKAMLGSAVLSPFAVVFMAHGLARLGPGRLVPMLFAVSAAAFGGEFVLVAQAPQLGAGLIYLHVAVLGALLVSGFWSVVSERFDPHTAKRVISRISAGATLGGLLGGVIAQRVGAWADTRTMLLVLAGLSGLAGVAVWRMGGRTHQEPTDGGVLAGLSYLREAPYLKTLSVMAVLMALTSGVLDYAFKSESAAMFTESKGLMTVFAAFYTVTGLITFLAQALLSRPALMRLGIGGTMALLPGAVLVGSVLATVVSKLWSLVVVRGAEEVLSNSLYRSSYELLFTPLSPDRKRPTKTVIDVGFKRVGDALGSALVWAVVLVAPLYATRLALVAAIFASALGLWLALRLHRGYVNQLASSLLDGQVVLHDDDIVDATTRRTFADTTMAIDRADLLAQIDELRTSQGPPLAAKNEAAPLASESLPNLVSPAARAALAALSSGDTKRIHAVLAAPLPHGVVPFVLPLLGHGGFGRSARRALRLVAPHAVGALIDGLFDEDLPEIVRRRLPDLIAAVPERRAAVALFDGVIRTHGAVRSRCVRALGRLVELDASLKPSADDVFAALEVELSRLPVSIAKVFALLGLLLDKEPLRVALSGLRSDDPTLRGTSFEYLENVLPEAIREIVWPRLEAYAVGDAPLSRRSQRGGKGQAEGAPGQSVDALPLDQDMLPPHSSECE